MIEGFLKQLRFWGITASICLLPVMALAQDSNLEQHVEQASVALVELDNKAEACLTGLNSATALEAKQSCDEFMQAIDGELLAGYLTHCDALKIWREEFVSDSREVEVSAEESAEMLQLLVGVEFACGEGALQKRTQFVISAFSLLQDDQIPSQRANAALTRRLAEMKFEATLNNERRLLQNSVLQQQARRELETQRQINDLENELIRQQIRNH